MMQREDTSFFLKLIWKSIAIRLRREFGTGGLAFLYHQGRLTGLALAERYRKMGVKNLKNVVENLLIHAFALGRYRGELVHFSYGRLHLQNSIIIRLRDGWECMVAKRHKLNEPSSHFERGVLAGLIEGFLGDRKTVLVEEVKCIAKGDPYCGFTATFPSETR
ncbi:MAG: hypothetical protein J7L38_02925 [Thermoproteales archaeon]|nr:hypothetical protein [Thermoproteales archaeon]